MAAYLCSVSGQFPENYQIGLTARTWGVEEKFKKRIANVQPGDTLVFTVGGVFRSIHRIESSQFEDSTPLWPEKDGSVFPFRVKISEPIAVGNVPIKAVNDKISFMAQAGKYWSLTLQGVKGDFNDSLTPDDLALIRAQMGSTFTQALQVQPVQVSPEKIKQVQEKEKALFKFYETDVEERIIQSLGKLNLRLYVDSATGKSGRQFVIDGGSGRIDLLCEDVSTGDFVVVELKKGEAPQIALLQILKYVSWVRQHMAGKKAVKGILTEAADSTLSQIAKKCRASRFVTTSSTFN